MTRGEWRLPHFHVTRGTIHYHYTSLVDYSPYFARFASLLSLACVFVSLVMLVCLQSTEETERERERKDKIVGSGENFWFVWRFFAKECTKEVVFPNYVVVVVSCEKPQISCPYIYGFDILSIVTSYDRCCHRLGAQFFFDYSIGFRNREFLTRFLFFCRLRLFCVLPFRSAFASSTHFVFSSLLENRRERKRDVRSLRRIVGRSGKKGVCSICLIICCCWLPSEAAASFSRSKTCATHNESDGFDGRWRRVSSFSSIAISNSETRRA